MFAPSIINMPPADTEITSTEPHLSSPVSDQLHQPQRPFKSLKQEAHFIAGQESTDSLHRSVVHWTVNQTLKGDDAHATVHSVNEGEGDERQVDVQSAIVQIHVPDSSASPTTTCKLQFFLCNIQHVLYNILCNLFQHDALCQHNSFFDVRKFIVIPN